MDIPHVLHAAGVLAPAALMAAAALATRLPGLATTTLWRALQALAAAALVASVAAAVAGPVRVPGPVALEATTLGLIVAVLVQLLGTVVAGFSARYLEGEAGQRRYVAALAGVLASVHLLLLADHWLVLVAAWAAVGMTLQPLLCFYPDRPFARLAAHKKRLADRAADALLLLAAALAWREVGSGSLSALGAHVGQSGMSTALHVSALALVLAVLLRTASLPVHGWLVQVMEAPTPVSALLHAGVVNLGGFVLIRFAPLLEQAPAARGVLLAFGLTTAVLAGMVMLTRVSVKVRLAWSTVAQMGFMLLEVALGLYTLAALHLVGHSLYKAHAFLSASTAVRRTRRHALHQSAAPTALSLALAPLAALAVVLLVLAPAAYAPWPWWWSAVLGLAWAPLLWLPGAPVAARERAGQALAGLAMVAGLTAAAWGVHALPLGLRDAPHHGLGAVTLAGMLALYACLALLQRAPAALAPWRRWSYAGFYVDEAFTRLALRLWPTRWAPTAPPRPDAHPDPALLADARR
ncbi:MAG: NADH-quinone oxidoreductase subunit L [Trueperaceae bacterium]